MYTLLIVVSPIKSEATIDFKHFKGLVTNYGEGGGYKTGGGVREVLPLRKGGAEKVLAMLKGGHKKFWGSFYVVAWSLSHIVGEARKVSTL